MNSFIQKSDQLVQKNKELEKFKYKILFEYRRNELETGIANLNDSGKLIYLQQKSQLKIIEKLLNLTNEFLNLLTLDRQDNISEKVIILMTKKYFIDQQLEMILKKPPQQKIKLKSTLALVGGEIKNWSKIEHIIIETIEDIRINQEEMEKKIGLGVRLKKEKHLYEKSRDDNTKFQDESTLF